MKTYPLSRPELMLAMSSGYRPKWLFFWGHTPTTGGRLTEACFSQWWGAHPFIVDGVQYRTAEHYMMAEKARVFHDEATRTEILAAKTPAQAKALGRKVLGFDEHTWSEMRFDVVVKGNLAKFTQHVTLREFLSATKKQILVEASPADCVWGIGLARSDEFAQRPSKWRGENLLGFALMKVRNALTADMP
jgi:ribA/ribD-fused uncharacterized protein